MENCVYVTIKQPVQFIQMSIEEFLFSENPKSKVVNSSNTNTRTTKFLNVPQRIKETVNVEGLIETLEAFNESIKWLKNKDKKDLYYCFLIPKRSGSGFRNISAPCDELKEAQRRLKAILENDFHALYHTSAFAYIRRRCTVDAMKRHQSNESKWYAKFDFSDFFGSTTKEFVMRQFSMIFPFSEVMASARGRAAFDEAIDIAFLDGVLPQGTPLSPTITNVMMIPIDLRVSSTLRNSENRYVYTRYADDLTISSRYKFNPKEIEDTIVGILNDFEAPFSLNREKTRFGSSAGRNWNLGLMITADNKITVGNKRKRQFQRTLDNYVMDRINHKMWPLDAVQTLDGNRSYINMVEDGIADKIVEHVGKRFGVNVNKMIKEDLAR